MFGDLLSPSHLIVLLIIAVFVFGPKRLPELGKGLGQTIRDFKGAVNGSNPAPTDVHSVAAASESERKDG
ncbi:MAG: twin-arginine translocase TatA/TatE family subunit [Sulfobacillus sp.]|nr:twin-arginine translocase TatA/TatE family subunit [Sulfobacillus sp.]